MRQRSSRSRKILTENIDKLHIIAKGLLEYETLTEDEIKDLLKGIQPTRDDFDNDSEIKKSKPTQSVPKTGAKFPLNHNSFSN